MNFRVKAKQDFIFFGVSFVEKWFPKEAFKWFVRDGSLALKNQTCFIVNNKNPVFSLDKLLDFLCYLSGGATLTRCFVSSSSLPIVASSTEYSAFRMGETFLKQDLSNSSGKPFFLKEKGFAEKHSVTEKKNYKKPSMRSLAYWEEESIKIGGGQLGPRLPAQIFQNKEMALKNVKTIKQVFCLNADYVNTSKIEPFIMELSDSIIKGVYGSFKPEHSKAFSSSSFQVLWPGLLQGYFPRGQDDFMQGLKQA